MGIDAELIGAERKTRARARRPRLRLRTRVWLAAASGAAVALYLEARNFPFDSAWADFAVPGLFFAAGVLGPHVPLGRSLLRWAFALCGASALSFLCAVTIVLGELPLIGPGQAAGPALPSFIAASVAGTAIAIVAARLLLPLRVTGAYWLFGIGASVLGGAGMYAALERLGGGTSASVAGFALWHALLCIAIDLGSDSSVAAKRLGIALARVKSAVSAGESRFRSRPIARAVARARGSTAVAAVLAGIGLVLVGAVRAQEQPSRSSDPSFVPVTDAMLANPDPDDWLMWRRTLDSHGYSPLAQIDRSNVVRLSAAWSVALPDAPSQEGIALVYDGRLYFPAPMDVTLAFDAATGEPLWEHRRDLPEDVGRYVPNPQTNRNLAIYDRLVIDNGADDTVYALDAETGDLVWETTIHDYRVHTSKQGSAPLVVRGMLISGRHCATQGGPDACVITAHDALTGEELWRKRNIPRPGEPGDETWGDVPDAERWQVGSWMVPSYDPELDIVYVGTSVTAPAPKYMLSGNDLTYLFHNSTLALDPDTGETLWYYQHLVDHWDLDYAFERMLVDTAAAPDPAQVPWINPRLQAGETYAVVTGIPGKTGLIYTLDRATGEFLWARPTIEQNVIERIGDDGSVHVASETLFTGAEQQVFVCPSSAGGKNWPAGAYSPRTNTMYFALANTCMTSRSTAEKATAEMVYAIDNETMITPGTENVGTVRAYSAETGREEWTYDQRAGVMGLLATGGDLVFGGDLAGIFRALDAETGELLWQTDLGAPVTGHPVAFAVGGRQYVAVSTGRANLTGTLGRLAPEARTDGASRLFVFAVR